MSILHKVYSTRSSKPWFHNVNMTAHQVKILNRVIVGTTYDKVYLYNSKIEDNVFCSCGQVQSFTHLVFECPEYDCIRSKYELFKKFDNFIDIFKEKRLDLLFALASFLVDAKFKF